MSKKNGKESESMKTIEKQVIQNWWIYLEEKLT